MPQVQAAYIASAGGGSGTLFFGARSYPFTVAGAGVGGIGASTIEAEGEVYDLADVARFPSAYAQGRYGLVIGTRSTGELWLKNENEVAMHLHAKRTGLMLSLGGMRSSSPWDSERGWLRAACGCAAFLARAGT